MCFATHFQPPNVGFCCQTTFSHFSCCLDEWKSEFVKRGFGLKMQFFWSWDWELLQQEKTWFLQFFDVIYDFSTLPLFNGHHLMFLLLQKHVFLKVGEDRLFDGPICLIIIVFGGVICFWWTNYFLTSFDFFFIFSERFNVFYFLFFLKANFFYIKYENNVFYLALIG